MSDEVLIRADNVGKKFCRSLKKSLIYGVQDVGFDILGMDRSHAELREGEFWANQDISFELKRGECLGLIGHNGAGKTTLLKMLNGLVKPDAGFIEMRGRVGAMIALGAGFNPILTGRENIYIAASVLGFSKNEIDQRFDEIVEFSEISEFIDTPVQSYSSGMQVRLGFSVASSLDPDVLLIDEVLAVGDVGFRTKCYNRIYDLCNRAAVIFVSHNMAQIDRLCGKGLLLNRGTMKFLGEVNHSIDAYNKQSTVEQRPEHFGEGVEVHSITFNGNQYDTWLELKGSDSLKIGLDVTLPERINTVEISVTFHEKSMDLISQSNTRFRDENVVLNKTRNFFEIMIPRVSLGSGLKKLSVNLVDGETNEILYWGPGTWDLEITNDVYIPTPSFNEAIFSVR